MSHTIKTKAGNKKRKGLVAEQLARENKQHRKQTRLRRDARKHKHD